MSNSAVMKERLASEKKDGDGQWSNAAAVAASPMHELATEMNASGQLVARRHIASGEDLFVAKVAPVAHEGYLAFNDAKIPHSCDSNCVIIEGHLISRLAMEAGTVLSVNLNLVFYTLENAFQCRCTSPACKGVISGFKSFSGTEKNEWMYLTQPLARYEAMRDGHKIQSSSRFVDIRKNGEMGQATFASTNIPAGTQIFKCPGLVIPFPTIYTIQLALNKHLLFSADAQSLAHHCDPNAIIVVHEDHFEAVAKRDIADGELVSFNYLTTEWQMDSPFDCLCGSNKCYGRIRGFRFLSEEQQSNLLDACTEPVKVLAAAERESRLASRAPAVAQRAFHEGEVIVERLGTYRIDAVASGMRFDGGFVRHTCSPNTVFVEGYLIARRAISAGEPLTIDLCLFNYTLDAPFKCTCGSEKCHGNIAGFKYLDDSVKQELLYLSEPNVRATAMNDGFIVRPTTPLLEVRPNGGMGQTAFATQFIPSGTVLYHCFGLLINYPTMYTICIRKGRHLLFGQAAECIPHHCDPNVRIVVTSDNTFDMQTVRDVAAGEMVSFNYVTSEYEMNSPFHCLCGSQYCAKEINGAQNLSEEQMRRIWPLCTEDVKSRSVYQF